MDVKLRLTDGYFWGTTARGASLKLGAGNSDAPSPMEALLFAVGGCSGIDVASTLKKMRQPLAGLEIDVSGQRRDQHPRYFETITITYRILGLVDEDKARRAIELSLEKYCSVSNALAPKARVSYQLEIAPGE